MKRILGAVLCLGLALTAGAAGAASFSDWAVAIAAGDYHAHSGAESEVFDNARRDLGTAFRGIGFSPNNMIEFSVRPEKYPRETLQQSEQGNIADGLWDLSKRAHGGCLIYFTSHGSPDGILVGDKIVSPDTMARIVGNACGALPTVVILSACYSGVFVPLLAAPNRMIFTAARNDRPSFGCGEEDKYTFFDTCFLQSLTGSSDFPGLAQTVQACVAAREQQYGVPYASEPQLSVGADVAGALRWR